MPEVRNARPLASKLQGGQGTAAVVSSQTDSTMCHRPGALRVVRIFQPDPDRCARALVLLLAGRPAAATARRKGAA